MADFRSINFSIKSNLLTEILIKCNALPNDPFHEIQDSIIFSIHGDSVHFSDDETFIDVDSKDRNMKTIDDFFDFLVYFVDEFSDFLKFMLGMHTEAKSLTKALKEIKERREEIKDDILEVELNYSVDGMNNDDDYGLILFESMPQEDAEKFLHKDPKKMSGYSFFMEYSFLEKQSSFNYGYSFEFND